MIKLSYNVYKNKISFGTILLVFVPNSTTMVNTFYDPVSSHVNSPWEFGGGEEACSIIKKSFPIQNIQCCTLPSPARSTNHISTLSM